ncbi:MAG: hypothetical protein Q4F28_12105 [Eubacteriales bacterium]|nr:hypothetical protein [Eubacteriales bacterium]
MIRIPVHAYDAEVRDFRPALMIMQERTCQGIEYCNAVDSDIYCAPGFIDSHAHIYPGATDLGIRADSIGLSTGVHMVIDAGSAGSTNFPCFRDYIVPTYEVEVRGFLNISQIGLVNKQPYFDRRNIDIQKAVECIRQDDKKLLLGIKVLSSGLIVEDAGIEPIRAAVAAAERIGCPVMAHMVEGPPSNEENMAYLRKGDIITHIFHGVPNIIANQKASNGRNMNASYCSLANVMWNEDGTPKKPLEDAIARGVYLDVGHGAASLDQNVARAAIGAGVRQFSISTDAHIRNVDTIVYSLAHTMSKFLAFGMSLADVVASVTEIPSRQLGLRNWCTHMERRATLFRVRPRKLEDLPFLDAYRQVIDVDKIIEPIAVNVGGEIRDIISDWIPDLEKYIG